MANLLRSLVALFLSLFPLAATHSSYPTPPPPTIAIQTATPTPSPTPAPTLGSYTALVTYNPKYVAHCPDGVTTFKVPPCEGPYPNYPVNLRNPSGQIVYTGHTNSAGKITMSLPPGKYYWIQNETDPDDPAKKSGRRDFTIIAGRSDPTLDIFVVFVDIGVPAPTFGPCHDFSYAVAHPQICNGR